VRGRAGLAGWTSAGGPLDGGAGGDSPGTRAERNCHQARSPSTTTVTNQSQASSRTGRWPARCGPRWGNYQHPVGKCRIGPPDDPDAVVAPDGHVHGVDRLSVADASIMPTIPSANTNLPTMMIAEHLASSWP
jgi:choline dehydrogenase-like flavoprotein